MSLKECSVTRSGVYTVYYVDRGKQVILSTCHSSYQAELDALSFQRFFNRKIYVDLTFCIHRTFVFKSV